MGLIPQQVRSYAIRYYPNDAADTLLGFGPLQGVLPLRLRKRFHALFLLRTLRRTLPRKTSYAVP
jgi:hypothetical protein